MNAVGMIFQQVKLARGTLEQNSSGSIPLDKQTAFQNLLTSAKSGSGKLFASQSETPGKMPLTNKLMSGEIKQLTGKEISKEEAKQLLEELYNSLEKRNPNETSEEDIVKMLEENFGSITIGQDRRKSEGLNNKETEVAQLLFLNQAAPEVSGKKTLQQQFEGLFKQVEKLLSQVTDQKSLAKAAPALLKLLEQWSALEKKHNTQPNSVLGSLQNEGKEQAIWKDLLQAYQRRNQLAVKQQYNTSAKVTTTDVTKWLQHAVGNQAKSDKSTAQQSMSFSSSIPLSKVEQYAIHMNQSQTAQSVDKQLIEQFQKVMKTSRFLTMQNGNSQLNITLRPENLGDMMVKLTQINGEMTVKIMVNSHAAKNMLEANMHQLKHMFSPQQVVVEKQDVTAQQVQTYQSEQEEESMAGQDQNQGESNHSEQDDDNQSEEDFESQFQRVLLNEEV